MSGNGIAGVVVGLSRIMTKALFPEKYQISALMYFSIAALVLVACLVTYFMMLKMEFAQYYSNLSKEQPSINGSVVPRATSRLTNSEDPLLGKYDDDLKSNPHWTQVIKKIWPDCIMVFYVFFLTLSVFPGFVLLIGEGLDWAEWYGVFLVFTFQVFDLVGRTLPRWFLWLSPATLPIGVYSRTVFFPLFFLSVAPALIGWPWSFVFMTLFALTNGYCGTLAMMYAPQKCDDNEKETGAAIMSFFLNLGILFAGHFGILLLYIVEPEALPFHDKHSTG
jgi:equilibrative nucleoside transporter 1/2/3